MFKVELTCSQNSTSTGSNEWSINDIPVAIPDIEIPSADKMKFSIVMSGKDGKIDAKIDLGEEVELSIIRIGSLNS